MLRIRSFQLVATGLLLLGAAPSATLAQDDISRSATADCNPRQLRAIAAREVIANFVGCQYEEIRSFLPPFATVNWITLDGTPVGRVVRQSAGRGTPYAQLGNRFALTVSAGPRVSIATPTVIDGGTLRFQMSSPVRAPSPYRADYWLALDSSGRDRARAGTHYASASDNGFLQGGTLDVSTRLGSGVDRLYVIVILTFSPDGQAANAALGSGVGRIVQYPRVSVSAAPAPEGSPLTFAARIDRSGLPSETLAYRFELQGNAERGIDYVAPSTDLLTFPPGQEVTTLAIGTLDNRTIFDDRRLDLLVAIPGQRPAVAQGRIANTTVRPADEDEDDVRPADESEDDVVEQEEEEAGASETDDSGPGPTETATSESDDEAQSAADDDVAEGNGESEEKLVQQLTDWGMGWLAAIGAIAIGLLAGFLFGAKSQKPAAAEEEGEEDAPEPGSSVAPVPLVGWTTAATEPPAVKGGSVPIDGPSVTIDAELGEGRAGRLESMLILSEGAPDE